MNDWLLNCEPRPGQIEALNRSFRGYMERDTRHDEPHRIWLREGPARGWGHFLEMRVGKTPVALNEYMLFKRDEGIKKLLVIAPNAYKLDWVIESEKFGVDCPAFSYGAKTAKKMLPDLAKCNEWVLAVNYEVLGYRKHFETIAGLIGADTMLVADESVHVKNHNSGFFKNTHALSKEVAVSRVLSGKPVIQGPHDLWAQLRIAKHLDGFGYYPFRGTFCKMGGFKGRQVKGGKNEDKLNELLATMSWQARRRDWMDDAGVEYVSYQIQMTDAQIKAYQEMEQEMFTLAGEDYVTADQIITKLLRLQQITSGFSTTEDGDTVQFVPNNKNPLFCRIREMIESEIKSKVIVVAQFKPTIDGLLEMLAPFNPQTIRGSMSAEEKIQAKAVFNEDPTCRVLVGQVKALKYGHTLMGNPGDPCYYTLFAENSYSLDDRAQAEQRNQGEGQNSVITVADFFASQIHRDIIGALQNKEDVCARVFGYARDTGILPG